MDLRFMKKIWNKIICLFRGHSHPWFICAYCETRSLYYFKRDENGDCLRNKKGEPRIGRRTTWLRW